MSRKKSKILIVDDEQVVCDVLCDELREQGYLCTAVLSGGEALAKLSSEDFDLVLLDIKLPGMSGMEVLRDVWLNHINTATIMITAVNDVDTAVEAMKLGAFDYIVKPFDLDRVDASIRTALETGKATDRASSEMDAIAIGIEAKLDPLATYSKIVTQRTIAVARQLGIMEEEIQRWAASQTESDSKRTRVSETAPNKPRRK